MKIIEYLNRFNINFSDIWFCDDFNNISGNYDIINLKGYKTKIKGGKNILQYSLLLDLTKEEDVLFENIRKNVKYEINRCYKENVTISIYTSEELKINNDETLNFEKMYNQMYMEKNMNTRLALNMIKKYIEADCFTLTKAISENGKTLAYHAYVSDEKTTRLLYSCSNFRSDTKEEKNLIARANKFLHWEDIKYFKKNDVKTYDFGGITSVEKPNGIDQFKMAFSGETTEYYNITITKTLKGKIYKLIKH